MSTEEFESVYLFWSLGCHNKRCCNFFTVKTRLLLLVLAKYLFSKLCLPICISLSIFFTHTHTHTYTCKHHINSYSFTILFPSFITSFICIKRFVSFILLHCQDELQRWTVVVRRTTNANFLIAVNKQRLFRLRYTLDMKDHNKK